MSTLGNILWIIFGGFVSALLYVLGGALCCLTIIGIPFGMQAFKLAGASLTPFGRSVVSEPDSDGTLTLIFNVIWVFTAGWMLACSHLAHAAVLAVTIVGIPFAVQHLKMVPLCLLPFSHDLR
jgi:uncharacterized membrane protein YccF (DUF307 family)